jgi:spermidine synthase
VDADRPTRNADPSTLERRVVERTTTRNGELQLSEYEEGDAIHREIVFNGVFLMASYNEGSCKALTDAVVRRIPTGRKQEMLVAGLGMGYVLRHALHRPSVQSVCVVELEPTIVEWNRTRLGNGEILDDPRTEVVLGDFHDFVQGTPRSYHGIVVDIDNGPDWVVRNENRRVYSMSMLEVLRTRLRGGGALGIWAHAASGPYERALREVFGNVEVERAVDVDPFGKELECVLYLAAA